MRLGKAHMTRRGRFILIITELFVLAITGTVLFLSADARLRPVIREYAVSNASYLATKAINDAVNDELIKEKIEYSDLITLEKDINGRVTALHTNIVKTNQLKATMTNMILEELNSLDTSSISVPIGNAAGIDFLSGWGPTVDIVIIPVGSAGAEFLSAFSSAGINQTRHRITMEISADVSILLPREAVTVNVQTQVAVAETVIIGVVPDNYTNIEDSRDVKDKIIDYELG